MRFTGLATLPVVALCACGGAGGGGGPQASSIALSAGDNQVAAAGAALPESLAVIVRDNAGAALPGVAVTWSVTAGGGTVSPTTRTSDAGGIAKTRRTLGPNAGTQTARATVAGLSPVNFNAVSQIQGAVNIANATTGPLTDTVLATKAESLDVLVTDQNAAPKQGVAVPWASTGRTVPGNNAATSATGHSKDLYTYGTTATAQRTLGSGTGDQTATATASGLPGTPLVTFTTTAQLVASITIADNSFSPSDVTVPLHTTVTWSWTGVNTHNVTFTTVGAPANIGNMTTGSASRTFDTAGTFQFHCTIHPSLMTGSVTVNP